jgi:hypothetical protein
VDTKIAAGGDWYGDIQLAMDDSKVAILLVSANFLASQFIQNEEIPRLLERHSQDGMLIIPLIARPCAWELVPWLGSIQARPKNGVPLSNGTDNDIDKDLADFTYEVASLLRNRSRQSQSVTEALADIDNACRQIRSRHMTDSGAITAVIATAIRHGATRNAGDHMECAQIYDYTARQLQEMLSATSSCGRSPHINEYIAVITRCLPPKDSITPQNANRLACQLRKGFDSIVAMEKAI